MKNSVVNVLGSINADLVISSDRMPTQGETIAGYDYYQTIGGKGGNQAVACAKLGSDVNFIGSVGKDYHGDLALAALRNQGVCTDNVEICQTCETGVAIILKSEGDNRIIINPGANAEISDERILNSMHGGEGDLFLTQFEVPIRAVEYGLKVAKEKGMITVVNPAPAYAIADSLYQTIDYLVLNQSETHELAGVFPEDAEACRKIAPYFLSKGVKHVVFTMGCHGSILVDASSHITMKSYKVDVVDTTGAGDAYIGTLMYGLAHSWNIEKCLHFASAAGAMACSKQGAQISLPTFLELEQFINERSK